MFNLIRTRILANKNFAELYFWKVELENYLQWYNGKIDLYGIKSPRKNQKIVSFGSDLSNSVATWNKVFQERKYLNDLRLSKDAFINHRVCDIGSGPLPSALCFEKCDIYGTDHLIKEYGRIGFPMNVYENRYHFIDSKSETMPYPDNYFDAVISVNAIDHVDNFALTVLEIKRVLKENGKVRIHMHYHSRTDTEPIELSDKMVKGSFKWLKGFKKFILPIVSLGTL